MNSTSNAVVSETRTKTFSMRLTEAEHAKLREIARRLGATEATVMRFAIRSMLNRLAPLHDPDATGFSLIPVFVEHGAELAGYFDLDVARLGRILNGEQENGEKDQSKTQVEREDLVLLSMSGLEEPKVHAKLRELQKKSVKHSGLPETLRTYFYDKYIYRAPSEQEGD